MSHDHPTGPPARRPTPELFPLLTPSQPPAVDPVCHMSVDPATAAASHTYQGHTYYFCSPSCRQKFQADPQRYLSGTAPTPMEEPATPAPAGVEYVCPMHPEVVSDRP